VRRQDWPERLARFIAARRGEAFAWGRNDCCLFAADWALEATGADAAAEYRGRYRTRRGAYALLRRVSGGGVAAAATRAWGAPIAPLLAQRGDVVAVETEYGEALGVHLGERIAVVTPEGLGFLSPRAAEAAWRI
jgi:hypothetical protein